MPSFSVPLDEEQALVVHEALGDDELAVSLVGPGLSDGSQIRLEVVNEAVNLVVVDEFRVGRHGGAEVGDGGLHSVASDVVVGVPVGEVGEGVALGIEAVPVHRVLGVDAEENVDLPLGNAPAGLEGGGGERAELREGVFVAEVRGEVPSDLEGGGGDAEADNDEDEEEADEGLAEGFLRETS